MALLMVESDPDCLDLFCFAARRAGYETVPARDAATGRRHWQTKDAELVLVDVDLPDQSGWVLAQQIRQGARTPIILLTHQWTEADAIRSFALGADDYVTKPYSLAELLWRVRAVLRRAKREESLVV